MKKLFRIMDTKKNMKKSSSTEKFSISNLELRLEEFVTKFVTEFEGKLTSYSVILDGVIPKCESSNAQKVGQIVGLALGGAAGFSVGFAEFGANAGMVIAGKITKKIENKIGKNHHQCKLSKLSDFINYFEQNRTEFRKLLVKVGLDIFQSFEMQFGQVTSDLGERGAMNQLAIDAMNRAIDFISRTSADSKHDRHLLILEGVKHGQSKEDPVLILQGPGASKGFEVRFKHDTKGKTLKTGSLYSKVGIAVVNRHNTEYYHSKETKNKSQKYGFRRCFTCEKWEELKPNYVKANLYKRNDKLLDYSNYYSPSIVNEKVDGICTKLETDRDNALGIDRVNVLLNQSKEEILGQLQILKPISDKLDVDSKMLANIEADLKSLKCEEYFTKFDTKMDTILSEICKGNEETICKLEKINVSLKEFQQKFDSVNHVKSAPVQNSVWFDVRKELLTFTGRDAILNRMERDLDSGPVVVCGLGGIGKSELAVKYAHTWYDRTDNVIWVNAETEESLTGSIWQLAKTLELCKKDSWGKEKDVESIISEIYKLVFQQKCLLILDNAKSFSDIELLLRWSPDLAHCQPKVIITSRNSSEWDSGRFSFQIIQIDVFDRSEAIDFIQMSLCIEKSPDIEKLADVLGNFPLALQLAVNNIKINDANYKKRNKQFTIANFLEKFEREPQKLMGGKLPLDMYRPPYSIFVVVSYTFKTLGGENELGEKAQYILRMASYMSPDNIEEDFFRDEIQDEEELFAVMSLLENYSLVKINEGKLNVHRLVQQAVRLESEREEEAILRKNLNLLMKRLKNWNTITFYSPHIFSIWDFACNYGSLIEEFIIKSSSKFYIFSSFLESLVQRKKMKIVKKIITQILNGSDSNNLYDILRSIFGEKSIYFATHHPEMVKLLNAHEASTSHPPRAKTPLCATVSMSIGCKPGCGKKPIEAIAMRTEIYKLPELVRHPQTRPLGPKEAP